MRILTFHRTGARSSNGACRYVSRPPIAVQRLALTSSGQVRYTLKTPHRDGNGHCAENCLDLMARLAALVPPPKDAPEVVSRGVHDAQQVAGGGPGKIVPELVAQKRVRGLQVGAAVAGLVGAESFGPTRIVREGREGGIQAGLDCERRQGVV